MMYGCFTVAFLDAAVYFDSAPCNRWQQYDQHYGKRGSRNRPGIIQSCIQLESAAVVDASDQLIGSPTLLQALMLDAVSAGTLLFSLLVTCCAVPDVQQPRDGRVWRQGLHHCRNCRTGATAATTCSTASIPAAPSHKSSSSKLQYHCYCSMTATAAATGRPLLQLQHTMGHRRPSIQQLGRHNRELRGVRTRQPCICRRQPADLLRQQRVLR